MGEGKHDNPHEYQPPGEEQIAAQHADPDSTGRRERGRRQFVKRRHPPCVEDFAFGATGVA